jgi:hypothetical protein
LTVSSESDCGKDKRCEWKGAACEIEKCQLYTTGATCSADTKCSWNGYNCGLDKTIKCAGRRILNTPPPQRALAEVSSIKKIMFGQVECTVNEASLSATQIECTLKDEPVCGKWNPELYSQMGLIPVKADVVKTQIDCTITAIAPQ